MTFTSYPPGSSTTRMTAILKLLTTVVIALSFSGLKAQTIWGISGGSLINFDAATPGVVTVFAPITGIDPAQTLVGMDFRPLNGDLYALGYDPATGAARLYTIDRITGAATAVGTSNITLATGLQQVGMDFNPTVDRIRVTDANNNNYRLHPITGALVITDGTLAYAAADINNGTDPQIAAVAYTNSYIGSTSTTLFDYDALNNTLVSQIPPNNGTLNTIGVSGITVTTGSTVDMDIYYDVVSGINTAYFMAAEDPSTSAGLYTMDLTTGAVTPVGMIGSGIVIDVMAVQIDVNLPATVAGQIVYGLTSVGYLVSFDSEMPETVRSHRSISGISAGQVIVGMDSRPATGQLYLLGYNATTGDAQLYTLDPATGVATSVAVAVPLAAGMTNVSFDFNPTVDRIRVTSAEDNNYRLHPTTGALAFTDGNLAYNASDVNAAANPNIAGAAYTNSFIGGTSTQLIGYDADLNTVTLQNPPNNGTLNTVGLSGITINAADPTVDFDFFFDTTSGLNENYMVANLAGSNFDHLYKIDISTGAATLVGKVGYGTALTDIAVEIQPNIPGTVAGEIIYGITASQYLITFDSEAPSVVRSHLAVTGIAAGQLVAGLDVRPATGELYALGYNSTTGDVQLYTIDAATGVATSVAAPVVLAPALGNIGMDFNPTVDRIRVVTSTGMNYRMHPTTGALVATDGSLSYAAGDANEGATPSIGSGAYTNSFGGTNNTVLFDYDDVLNILVSQSPPNAGTLNTVGSSGITQSTTDATSDLDIFYNHDLHTNTAFLIANTAASDSLYTVNTTTGVATSVGLIGNGIAVRDIAVRNDSITAVSSTATAVSPVVCDTYTAADGTVYTTSGTYTVIIPNAAGYDSLITVNLVVNNSTISSITEAACVTYTAPDGAVYTASGTYTATIPNAAGCDSTITINLTINNGSASTISETACDTYTAPDGAVYTASGTYTATIPNAAGCDSTITINLTINNGSASTISETACDTYTAPDGAVYTASGTYTATIPNAAGCDSTITINLTISGPAATPTFTTIAPICQGDDAPVLPAASNEGFNGTWNPATVSTTASGTYTFTPTAGQCATTAQLSVTVNPAVTPTFTPIAQLCKDDPAPSLPATSNNGIPGMWNPATVSTATVGTSTYTFTPATGECATSATISVVVDGCIGIAEQSGPAVVSLYPNPTTGILTIIYSAADAHLVMTDAMGREVLSTIISQGANAIDLSNLATGLYTTRIGSETYSIVKQ